jgi:putative transposase
LDVVGPRLRNKTPKRKVKAKLREGPVPATAPTECWSMDFLPHQLFDGRKIRVLSIVDNLTLLSPALDAQWTCTGFVPVTDLIMPPWLRMRAG